MSNFRDLIARMAIDAEFARHARANPDAVAQQYRLSSEESEQLRGLADAAASAGPTALGARLSKMGGLTSSLSSQLLLTGPDSDGDGVPDSLELEPIKFEPKPVFDPTFPTGPIILDQDVLDPRGDPDHDGIPNILDSKNNNPNTAGEAWGDADKDGIPNVQDSPAPGEYNDVRLALLFGADSDGDGIKDKFDAKDHDPDTSKEALGDNDGDGIYNYLDKFKLPPGFPIGPILEPVLDPGPGTPPPADPTPPPADPAPTPPTSDGGAEPSLPDVIVQVDAGQAQPPAPQQQPILLADDVLAKPVTVAPAEDGGIGTNALIIGGAALAAGAVAGGIAGKVLGNSGNDKSQEQE